ncbi:MAG: tryptophan 2,3-dioxygenase, partial [Acidimicrobiaceae bacterium]|nr:tryptophan 2,3-dioxygenase [Acidimicrobiaceae bacterium]
GTDYSTYLRIHDLLKLQNPLSTDAPDELLFIVVHQSYELWFKVIIDELRRASTRLYDNEPWGAISHLRRMVSIEDLLLGHLRVLESMSPEGFLEFRDPLDPASGFQSFQFRAIEFLSGAGKASMLTFELFDDERRAWLRDMSELPSIWGGFVHSLRRTLGATDQDDVLDLLRALYRSHDGSQHSALHAVGELLMDHDERLAMWRHQHMLMAGRQIGRRPGTGGSEGMAYLDTTIAQRLFPLLWEVRSIL